MVKTFTSGKLLFAARQLWVAGLREGRARSRRAGLLALALAGLWAGSAAGQSRKATTTHPIIAGVNGLTVEAEISAPVNVPKGLVTIKYIYDGVVPVQLAYANWKLSYVNAADRLVVRQMSLPIGGTELRGDFGNLNPNREKKATETPFDCHKVVKPCFDIAVSNSELKGETIAPEGLAPDSVGGPARVEPGRAATLRLLGGALGQDARWTWYEGQCSGPPVGTGRVLSVSPRVSTTYFVRAEPAPAACLSFTVRVDNRSVAPAGIAGPASQCHGQPLTLEVTGGALGVDADWVWYGGGCGGGPRLGTGRKITISPSGLTGGDFRCSVRAEGKYNTTECAEKTTALRGGSAAATTVRANGPTRLCPDGKATELRVEGGKLAPGDAWAWYAGACTGPPLGRGATLAVQPTATTTYLVRAEGGCQPTAATALTLDVLPPSVAASSIGTPSNVVRNQRFTAQVVGGSLSPGAAWQWYATSASANGRPLGSGEQLSLKLRKPTVLLVKAVGPCGETACAVANVGVVAARSWEHAFEARKFMHVGVGFGLDYQLASLNTGRTFAATRPGGSARLDTVRSEMNGGGLLGELTWHPIIKDNFSLGLRSSAAAGAGLDRALAGPAGTNKRFSYYELAAGGELAVGRRRYKLLVSQEHRLREYRFEDSDADWATRQQVRNYALRLGAGVRLGAYARPGKPANTFDLLGYLTRTSAALNANALYSGIGTWNVGAGLAFWHHNVLGLRLETVLNQQQKNFNPLNTSFAGAQVRAALVLRQDFFR